MNRFENTKKVSVLGITGNIFLLLLKASIGIASNSQAMIADALNSASDIFASLMTFIGNKIASKPIDKEHNLGHGKAEYIFSMFISLSMMIFSLKLLSDSINSIINKNQLTFSWFLVIVCVVTIVTKLSMYIYTKKTYEKCKNILIKSSMKDHLNDSIVTTFTLFSVFLSLLGIYFVDGIVGMGISIWIFFTGIKIFKESYNVLMDSLIDEDVKELMLSIINGYEEVKKVDEIYSTPIGSTYIVVFTIYVDGNISTYESHAIIDNLKKEIESKIDIIEKVIIHVDPM
jgi:cation diffusion facilitator family transporter